MWRDADFAGGRLPAPTTAELGQQFLGTYLLPFEAAAVILLLAMVAAIGITQRQRKDSKAIDPSLQVRVRAADRLQVVQLAPTQPAPAAAAAEENKA